ncbi:MAG: MMPL family transporter [Akkermansiaceae bacterium]
MRKIIIALALLLVSLAGLLRMGFDTDILAMLPDEEPEVYGLKSYRDVLERGGALIITMECNDEDAGLLVDEADSLSKHLKKSGIVSEARCRPVFEEDTQGLGELIAYVWINGDPSEWDRLLRNFESGKSKETLEQSIERLGTEMDVAAMQLGSRDPLGFFRHSAMGVFRGNDSEGGGYESGNGMLHLVFVRPSDAVSGYRETKRWIEQVKGAARDWREAGDRDWLEIAYTGGPVFTSEVGDGMENDVRGTVGVTLVLVSLLFWWMQRRFWLLIALASMLILIFSLTLGFASLIYGNLSMMSVGFASILIGLAVDYGMVVCQEARVSGQDERQLRQAVTKGILWASVTTSAVFAALCMSSLPGIRQLGVLVAIGILSGAAVILTLYIPIVSRVSVAMLGSGTPKLDTFVRGKFSFLPSRFAAVVLALILIFSGSVLLTRGLPRITFDFSVMQPSVSPGMNAMAQIKQHMPEWNSLGVQVVVESDSDEEMLKRLAAVKNRVVDAQSRGDITQGNVPISLWPNASRQHQNLKNLNQLLAARERIMGEARDVGYSNSGLLLSEGVFTAMKKFAQADGAIYPESIAAQEILQSYLWRNPDGGGLARVKIITDAVDKPDADDLVALRRLNGDGAYTSGWALLSPAVLPLIYRDVTHIFVPMGMILLVMLIIVFRDVKDVILVSSTLAAPMLLVAAGMRLFGIDWDMLNIVTVPLLLGMGMDYGIHMVMALRRHAGHPARVWEGIGKALIFCGVSTAIGFGSLGMASNAALAGMGTLCSIGILLTMGCAVFVMPGVWRLLHQHPAEKVVTRE